MNPAEPAKPDALASMIIRPPRNTYEASFYPKDEYSYGGVTIRKEEFTILDHRGLKMPAIYFKVEKATSTVVYLHGNAGNKWEGSFYFRDICSRGINLLCYDASGCGNSEGDCLTLGWREANDLALIVDHLVEDHC